MYNYFVRRIDSKVKNIFDDCGYSIGTVIVFVPWTSGVSTQHIEYRYYVEGDEIKGKGSSYLVPTSGIEEGEKYIVVYSKKNVKNSVMLFKYSIKQDGDFENYLEEFTINPPRFIPRKQRKDILYID